jgi:DNA-binding CsgD family transcriptional regulator
MTYTPMKPSVGVLLLDSQLRLVHYTAEAAAILEYPKKSLATVPLDKVLPATRVQIAGPSKYTASASLEIPSGRRRYRCQAFVLDTSGHSGSGNGTRGPVGYTEPKIVVILERVYSRTPDITRWSESFQLTTRESETVKFLLKGLSSKEIGEEMHISPNTVKSFIKLVMAKVGASNRTGIIAKILEAAPPADVPEVEPMARLAAGAQCAKRSGATIGIRSPASFVARR